MNRTAVAWAKWETTLAQLSAPSPAARRLDVRSLVVRDRGPTVTLQTRSGDSLRPAAARAALDGWGQITEAIQNLLIQRATTPWPSGRGSPARWGAFAESAAPISDPNFAWPAVGSASRPYYRPPRRGSPARWSSWEQYGTSLGIFLTPKSVLTPDRRNKKRF